MQTSRKNNKSEVRWPVVSSANYGKEAMKIFYKLLAYALVVSTTNNFVWFALTFFAYLQTKSVIATGFVGGIYLVATAASSFYLGSLVDNHKKKNVLLGGSVVTLLCFLLGFLLFQISPGSTFTIISSPILWIFAFLLLGGAIAGNLLNIAIPTLVTHLVPEDKHDNANGMFGTVMGISFAMTSVASGLVLGFLGMFWVLVFAIGLTLLAILYLLTISIPEKKIIHTEDKPHKIDIKGTIKLMSVIPGLFALIILTTFNNFLGGVFMALMDAYGLSLVSVQVWGILWGFLSFGFIFGGLFIAKKGLGRDPLKTLFRVYIGIWVVCIFFTIQPSIVLLFIGTLIWMSAFPFIEATEQTIIQKVVPPERQGRVFGFAQSVEQSASPLMAFIIGPVTQLIFVPFMTDGYGAELIGSWYGTGQGRGIALVFSISGLVGLIVTIVAMNHPAYKRLSERYLSGKSKT